MSPLLLETNAITLPEAPRMEKVTSLICIFITDDQFHSEGEWPVFFLNRCEK
jgi:hypothetical protein